MLSTDERARLERECGVLARLLSGRPPDAGLCAEYVEAHALGVVRPPRGVGGFDRVLVALARLGALPARLADAHAALLDRGGLLRYKLVLVLALLECRAPSDRLVDAPTSSTRVGFVAGAALRGLGWLLLFVVGLLPLALVRLAGAVVAPRRVEPSAEETPA